MENTIQKTVHVLSQLTPSGQGPSKSFQVLVRSIGEAKTKHEEDRIIRREALTLKDRMASRDNNPRQMRENLVRLIYCEMLGISCPWGHIHAVTFTQKNSIVDKRIGYLTCSLVLHPDHELNMLLVNSIQRDLRSSNMLEVSMALIIICRLIGAEMIPAVLPLVREKLHHPKELVRKKALLALHHFYQCSPSSIDHLKDDVRKALSDPDPGVMEAALTLLHDMIQDSPNDYKDLTPAFVNILSQVISHRLPSEFQYHGVPAPWMQMKLLRILALLGADDAKVSEQIYPQMESTLACAESNSNVGQAINYECIRTITAIYPHPAVIKKAADSISRFLTNQNNNWKYLGITALAALVQVDPKYALDYQLMVIDCLDDPDETLKRNTLDLLYKMTNPANVTVITDRLLAYLRSSSNKFIKADLVSKLTQLAERFSPDNQWFIETMNSVFEVGGDLVRREVAHNLMRLIAEGTEDDDIDTELRTNAVLSYVQLLSKPDLPDIVIKIICWVIGEYAYVTEDINIEDVLEKITALMNNEFHDPRTRSWIINAITRLVAQLGYLPDYVHTQIALNLTSVDTDIQQRCSELLEFSQNLSLMQEVLPLDSACEDMEVDSSLSFLDTFVSEALVKGAPPYKPAHMRTVTEKPTIDLPHSASIKFEPYAAPVKPFSRHTLDPIVLSPKTVSPPDGDRTDTSSITTSSETVTTKALPTPFCVSSVADRSIEGVRTPTPDLSDGIKVKGERKWGKGGYNKTPAVPHQMSTSSEDSVPISINKEVTSDSGRDEPTKQEPKTSTKVSSIEAKPRLTPEQRRKNELASALFTGLSGPSKGVKTRSKLSEGKKISVPHTHPREETGNLLLDLQDLNFSDSDSATPTNSSPPINNAPPTNQLSLVDDHAVHTTTTAGLFDDLNINVYNDKDSGSSSPQVSSKHMSSTASDDLIGLFDSPLETTPTSNLPLVNSTPLLPVTQHETPLPLAIADSPIAATPSPQLPASIIDHPVMSGWDKKELARDVQMRITATKVLKPDELIIVLVATNQKQSRVDGVTFTVATPSNVKLHVTGGDTSELTWNGHIEGFGSVTRVVHIVPSSPSITTSVKGEVSYRNQRLFYDVTVTPSDVIRPLKMSTTEFGKKWGSFHNEKKIKVVSNSVKKVPDFMNLMSTQFNFHAIEIIGTEGICAGSYLPSAVCLVHGKISAQFVELWIKTSSGLLTESLVKHFQTIQ